MGLAVAGFDICQTSALNHQPLTAAAIPICNRSRGCFDLKGRGGLGWSDSMGQSNAGLRPGANQALDVARNLLVAARFRP